MRRGQMLSWLVVRHNDVANDMEQFLLVLIDLALSFATVMTSFFLLQKYEAPVDPTHAGGGGVGAPQHPSTTPAPP